MYNRYNKNCAVDDESIEQNVHKGMLGRCISIYRYKGFIYYFMIEYTFNDGYHSYSCNSTYIGKRFVYVGTWQKNYQYNNKI